ncbi:M20 family metallopeptidase [Aeromicrobium sp. CTD01-1L150]|uniref:M20 family metallopeptidase n=1 Tax=Aeromicrobium sp. CTD01-1L150 TaxID=3341830 RepID=UPI0035C03F1C
MDDVLELTRRLVAIDSQNPGPGEAVIATTIEHELAGPAGFSVRRLEPVAGRPNLVVELDAGPGPHLALSGHLDTKPVGEARAQWNTDPFELTVDEGVAYGLGATDMKGAVAAMLVALRRYAEGEPSGRVSLVLTADEEQGSDAGAKALVEQGLVEADAIVIGEPSGIDVPWEMMALVSRGICCFEVTVGTEQGHSGLSTRLGRNAVLVAADVLRALEDLAPPVAEPGAVQAAPLVNPGMLVRGGVAFGTWPGECSIGCEIRLVPGMHRDDVRAVIERTVAAAVGERARFDIAYVDGSMGWMPAVELCPQAPVVAAAQAACRGVLGHELPLGAYPGGTDATYFMGEGAIPTISSLGPGWLSVAHGANEKVAVADLHTAVDLYTQLMSEFGHPDRSSAPPTRRSHS